MEKVAKRQKLNYDPYYKTITFNEDNKIFVQDIKIRILYFKKKINHC